MSDCALETDRFLLRPIQDSDAELLFPITSDPNVTRYLRFFAHKTISDTISLIQEYKEHGDHCYCVIEKGTNNFIGVFCLKIDTEDSDNFYLQYYCGSQYWNKGINSELIKYFVENSKRLYGIKTLTSTIADPNIGSIRAVEKNGFTLDKKIPSRRNPDIQVLFYKIVL